MHVVDSGCSSECMWSLVDRAACMAPLLASVVHLCFASHGFAAISVLSFRRIDGGAGLQVGGSGEEFTEEGFESGFDILDAERELRERRGNSKLQ